MFLYMYKKQTKQTPHTHQIKTLRFNKFINFTHTTPTFPYLHYITFPFLYLPTNKNFQDSLKTVSFFCKKAKEPGLTDSFTFISTLKAVYFLQGQLSSSFGEVGSVFLFLQHSQTFSHCLQVSLQFLQ